MASPSALRPSYGRLIQGAPSLSALAMGRTQAPSVGAAFSTSAPLCKRRNKGKTETPTRKKSNRDMNPSRGVSALNRSGPREPLSMSDIPLPKPVDFKPNFKVDEKHGLWGFFPAPGKLMYTPQETEQHGRAWKLEELRKKSWEDLHSLWWVCCRERNMLSTSLAELERSDMGFGRQELENRDELVRKTMGGIRHALTERYYTWQDAVDVAQSDPEIDFRAEEGQAYNPSAYEDEVDATEAWEEIPAEGEAATKTENKSEKQTV